MPGVTCSVEMHNVFEIVVVVRREPLIITLSMPESETMARMVRVRGRQGPDKMT